MIGTRDLRNSGTVMWRGRIVLGGKGLYREDGPAWRGRSPDD